MVVLKEFKNQARCNFDSALRTVEKYARELIKCGWTASVISCGILSPDGSTIFMVVDAPYVGQIVQHSDDTVAYNRIKTQLLESGDFIEC